MSLIQIWLERDKARVAVDTLARPGGARQSMGHVSKLIPLTHAGVVLAYRGSDLAFFQVFAQFFLTPGNDDFDSIESAMPTRFMHAYGQFLINASSVPTHADVSCELFLVGHSRLQQKMACTQFNLNLRTGKAVPMPMKGNCRLAPGFENVPELTTDEAMQEVAARQIAWMRENAPKVATGGRLLIAELTRDSVVIRDVGDIESND
ncbi:hypothetical protein [Lysobacter tyrosinilyticus]